MGAAAQFRQQVGVRVFAEAAAAGEGQITAHVVDPQPSFQVQNAVEELSTINHDIDTLTARKRDLPKVLTTELGDGTHMVAGLKVQVSTPRTLDTKAFEAAYPVRKCRPLQERAGHGCAHTADSHNAWVRLMANVDIKASSLGLSLQRWLGGHGYYTGWLDGQFGPLSVKALQSFLKDRGHYTGAVDGDRGPETVRAEIAYLNSQRQHYKGTQPEPTQEETVSKQNVLEALADFEVPYYDHSRRETRNLPLPQSLRYISVGNGKLLDGQIELASQVAGLSEAVKALASHQGQEGAAIIAAVKETTTAAFNAALPAEVTVPLDGPTLTEEA